MAPSAEDLRVLEEAVRDVPGRLFVACSGGADSNRVLRAAAALYPERTQVCHFDHAWSASSADWAMQVRAQAADAGLPFVSARNDQAKTTEAQARQARYAWFETLLRTGDALLLGHHRLDQIETRWMRVTQGRPPRGMPTRRVLGQGCLIRPFLRDFPTPDPAAIVDPANQDLSYRRVQVRAAVLRATSHELDRLDRFGQLFDRLESGVVALLPQDVYEFDPNMDPSHQRHAIGLWIWKLARLAAPPSIRLITLLSQLPAAPDRQPAIQWEDQGQRWALRTYRGRLYLEPAVWTGPMPDSGWGPLGAGRSGELHALDIPPWQRPWVWQRTNDPNYLRRWFPKVRPAGQISLEYVDLND